MTDDRCHYETVLLLTLQHSPLYLPVKTSRYRPSIRHAYWGGWPCPGSIPGAGHLSRYVASHPGQLSLAIPSWVGAMSTSQRAVMPCGWGVKAGMVRVWVAGKTVW